MNEGSVEHIRIALINERVLELRLLLIAATFQLRAAHQSPLDGYNKYSNDNHKDLDEQDNDERIL